MKLGELIEGLGLVFADGDNAGAEADIEIKGITYDSRKVEDAMLFAAIKGEEADGKDFIEDAVKKGAVCVLTSERTAGLNVPQIVAPDVRGALAVISERLYGSPGEALTMVGVTGTNGKTTTAYLVEAILKDAELSTGVVGTVNYRYPGKTVAAERTTPEAPELSKLLSDMVDSGVSHCVMEVSSHALAQKRADGSSFDCAVFTNLTHEHLDYHHTMEEYFETKARLFRELLKEEGTAVINFDDPVGRSLEETLKNTLTFSISENSGADIYPVSAEITDTGTEARLKTPTGEIDISSKLIGDFNLSNIMAAVAVGLALNIKPEQISRAIGSIKRVPGRLERAAVSDRAGFNAYVDYAHTGDALERVLKAVGRVATGRVITVFGCGGDRDKTKRPEMGRAAVENSDIAIITSDNPRSEDPLSIIADIEAGLEGAPKLGEAGQAGGYIVIADRSAAIKKAVSLAAPGDTVLVAGKGHEDYQIIGDEVHHFDDMEELTSAVIALGERTR